MTHEALNRAGSDAFAWGVKSSDLVGSVLKSSILQDKLEKNLRKSKGPDATMVLFDGYLNIRRRLLWAPRPDLTTWADRVNGYGSPLITEFGTSKNGFRWRQQTILA